MRIRIADMLFLARRIVLRPRSREWPVPARPGALGDLSLATLPNIVAGRHRRDVLEDHSYEANAAEMALVAQDGETHLARAHSILLQEFDARGRSRGSEPVTSDLLRAQLASFEHAYRVALQVAQATGCRQTIVRADNPHQPHRIADGPLLPGDKILVQII